MLLALFLSSLLGVDPGWASGTKYRILVEVPSIDLGSRPTDDLIVALPVDFPKLLEAHGIAGKFDPSSLTIRRLDLEETASESAEIPCRFDDDSLPEEYPSRVGRASETKDGLSQRAIRPRKGRIFNLEPASTRGKIVWSHRQQGFGTGRYAVCFNTIPSAAPIPPGPAPWLGDFDLLRLEQGGSLGGFAHFTVGIGDLNGDGLFDLVAGTEKGDILWFPNRGALGKPKFVGCRPLFDQHGPIDCGWYGAPVVYDWNDDHLPDLLIGTSGNVILWWKNVGRPEEAKWEYAGFVQADGKRLEVPESPVAEDTNDIFKRDYYNQPWIGDLNGDGLPEIVTGGYTTGRIFMYRGIGRNREGIVQLSGPEPVLAEGEPIDTVWAAAPALHDVDADGLEDLVSGGWFWSGIHRPPQPGEDDFLFFYKNVGTRDSSRFTRRPFPRIGELPRGAITRPHILDINNDGLVDLQVNDGGGQVYFFFNEGTGESPKWNLQSGPLTLPWGFATNFDASGEFSSLKHVGLPVMIRSDTLFSVEGGFRSPRLKSLGKTSVNGVPIDHPGPGYGDPYLSTILADWDGDGTPDLLWGTHQGEVYFHRKRPGSETTEFLPGEKLLLSNGEPLRVGPRPVDSLEQVKDFTILQGSRILMAAVDFDRDEVLDLVVTETHRKLWLFRGVMQNGERRLEPGIELLKLRTESLVFTDWNRDGKPDLLVGGSAIDPAFVCLNTTIPGNPSLAAPTALPGIPYVFWGPQVRSTDWNRDGDEDLLIQSEFLSFWGERSFLDRGYARASLIRKDEPVETR